MKVTIPMDYWTTSSKNVRAKFTSSITPLPNFHGDEQEKEIILTYVENS